MTRLKALFAALCLAPTLAFAQSASVPPDGRLKKIYDTKAINVAYRTDALPFSFEDGDKKPTGYTVDLCRAIVDVIERQLGAGPLQGQLGAGDGAEPLHDRQRRRGRHGMRRQHGDARAHEGGRLLDA